MQHMGERRERDGKGGLDESGELEAGGQLAGTSHFDSRASTHLPAISYRELSSQTVSDISFDSGDRRSSLHTPVGHNFESLQYTGRPYATLQGSGRVHSPHQFLSLHVPTRQFATLHTPTRQYASLYGQGQPLSYLQPPIKHSASLHTSLRQSPSLHSALRQSSSLYSPLRHHGYHTPTRQYASLQPDKLPSSTSQRLKPSRYSSKFGGSFQNGDSDLSLPPDLSKRSRRSDKKDQSRRSKVDRNERRDCREQDRIEKVRVKAGEIKKEIIRPSSIKSVSLKNSSDENSTQNDLSSLCEASEISNLNLAQHSSQSYNGLSSHPGESNGRHSTDNGSAADTTLENTSENCSPCRQRTKNCEKEIRTELGKTSNGDHKGKFNKNLNVAYSKSESKVKIDLHMSVSENESVSRPGQGSSLTSKLEADKKSASRSEATRKAAAVSKPEAAPKATSKTDPAGRRSEMLTMLVLSLVKMVDLGLHGFMLGVLLHCTYLASIYCQQSDNQGWHDVNICDKNSSLAPQLLNKPDWKMSVRDWSLILCIFHSAYFLLALLADLTYYRIINNINKYVLTVFPVERGFLTVLLITDSFVLLFSKNLDGVMETQALSTLVILATLCTITDTYFVLPRLRYFAKLDMVWLGKSGKFYSWWRPSCNLILVTVLVLYNLITSLLQSRMSMEVIPLTVFGFLYIFVILLLIIFVCNRKRRLNKFLRSVPETETGHNWRGKRFDLFLGALGLVSLNYLSIAPVAKPINFILTNFWM